jgi:hypothetical protein
MLGKRRESDGDGEARATKANAEWLMTPGPRIRTCSISGGVGGVGNTRAKGRPSLVSFSGNSAVAQ